MMMISRTGAASITSRVLALLCAAGLASGLFPHSSLALAPTTRVAPEPVYGKAGWQDDFLARSIVRAGLMDLRLRPAASSDDYRVLLNILGIAQGITPGDADIVRRLVEAAHNARDDAAVEAATRRLVQLDPSDTVAQLRLISARISRLQTAEERLKAYAGFLGDGGASFDPSIRSRLALDAALLCRELGDETGFSENLKAALRLDSTNKEAALIALSHYSERINEPVGRAQLLSNLLLSDPLDPNLHRQMAQEMAAGAAYSQALRFHHMAADLYALGGVRADDHFAVEDWVYTWAVEGTAGVIEAVQKLLLQEKYSAQQAEERAKKELREVTTKAEDVRLSPTIERIRLLAADTAQDQKVLDESRIALTTGVTLISATMDELERVKDKLTPEEALDYRQAAAVGISEIQILRLWANVDVDKVAADIEKAKSVLGDQPMIAALTVAEAWALFRSGKNEEALAAFDVLEGAEFERLADRSVAELEPDRIGKAMTLEALARPSEAAAIYKSVAISRSADACGMWCKLRLEKMGGSDLEREALSKQLSSLGAAVPHLVEDMVKDPSSTIVLSADVPQTLATPFDRNDLVIKIRNKTKIPLGLGTDRAINSRFLAQPAIEIHTRAQTASAQPEVLDLDRRLRLNPGETLEVRARVDAGYTGWLMESGAGKVVRSRFRIMQGFFAATDGTMRAGPGCMSADSPQIVRNPLKEALLSPPEMVDRLKLASGDDAISLILAMRARAMADESVGGPERAAFAQAIAGRYPSLDLKLRMLALVEVPNAAMFEEFKVFDDVARNEAAPAAAALAIVTRITDPADPALAAGMESKDAVTREIARLQKARLEASTAPTLSRRGFRPGIDAAASSVAPSPNAPIVPSPAIPLTTPAAPTK